MITFFGNCALWLSLCFAFTQFTISLLRKNHSKLDSSLNKAEIQNFDKLNKPSRNSYRDLIRKTEISKQSFLQKANSNFQEDSDCSFKVGYKNSYKETLNRQFDKKFTIKND